MEYFEKFDSEGLDENDKSILTDFGFRRKLFDEYLSENKVNLYTCPCCSYPTLKRRGDHEICLVCDWQDDYQDNETADEIWEGGPNGESSLTESRVKFGQRLSKLAKEMDGEINIDSFMVLKIISVHNKKFVQFLENMPEDAELDKKLINEFSNRRYDLLRMLVLL